MKAAPHQHTNTHAQTQKSAHAPLGFACAFVLFFEAMLKVESVRAAQVPERQAQLLGVNEKEKIGISSPAS